MSATSQPASSNASEQATSNTIMHSMPHAASGSEGSPHAPVTTAISGWGATRLFAAVMLVLSTIGEYFSFLITVDKIKLMQDPNFVPACTVSDIVSCSDVMQSPQASAFGFPNPLIGILGFGVLMTTAVVLLVGATLPRWFWWCTLAGMAFGAAFVHWLAYSAIFVIWALCPYCIVVWVVMIPLLIMTMVHMMRQMRRDRGQVVAHSVSGVAVAVQIAWYVGLALIIWMQFWM